MAYPNQWGNQNWDQSDWGYQGQNRNYGNRRQPKKHSGAKLTVMQKGKHKGQQCIVAWNYSRQRGLISVIAAPYKGTKEVKSKTGRKWQNWMVTIRNKRTMQETITSGLFDPASRKLIVNDLGMVMNPGAPNGGYFGKFTR